MIDRDVLRAAIASGERMIDVAARLGVSRQRIKQLVDADGLTALVDQHRELRRLKRQIAKAQTKEDSVARRWGCTSAQFQEIPARARYAYANQRKAAASRGIGWEFDLWSWWCVWRDSGKWEQRGLLSEDYCMSRPGDYGPYAPGNVEIITSGQNHRDYQDRRNGRVPDRIPQKSQPNHL